MSKTVLYKRNGFVEKAFELPDYAPNNYLPEEMIYDLDSRKVEEETKYLLIFPNSMLQRWYERYLNYRNDIIYITYDKLYNNGLVGLRYRNYYFVNNEETKQELEKVLPIIKE